MNEQIIKAVEVCREHKTTFFKYVSLSDAGKSKGHQAGLYIPKEGARLMFEKSTKKGENLEKFVTVEWFNGAVIENCRFIYYGSKTRNEFRITCLRKKLCEGDFLIMVKIKDDYYKNFILQGELEVNIFYKKLAESDTV